ncbi:hypothetical protein F5Y12DRAFT_777192 [Xylaria sp. FL1777]|nr:hypothetical protein F5Y12DRAFT_777192 [Xylaria sp. FL1777]
MGSHPSHIVASACDKDLYSSGTYSDVKVTCSGVEWSLHRAILKTRCPFFTGAVLTSDVIEIKDQDPEKVEWVIHFIYTGKVPGDLLSLLEDDETALATCIKLFILANFFSLEGLAKRAVDVFTEHVIRQASYIQRYISCKKDLQETVDDFSPQFLVAVRIVYNATNSLDLLPFRHPIMLYLKLTCYIVLRAELLGNRLREDPELANFQNEILNQTLYGPLEDYDSIEMKCVQCKREHSFVAEFEDPLKGPSDRVWCRNCVPLGEEGVLLKLTG